MTKRQPQCGEEGYERCPECQAHRSEPHLEPCSLRLLPLEGER